MYHFLKRLTDILIAATALLLLSPVFVFVIIILLLTGEHRVFYFQQRVGFRNKPFYIWKFATMLKNSPNMGTGIITLRNDPRVTAFGKMLRFTKMNELPQIINVLKGDMSIVGPRPLVAKSVDLYPPEIKGKIYDVKPGMTGMGSLVFRDEEQLLSRGNPQEMYKIIYLHKGELEMWYHDNASISTDFKIIFVTAWSIVFPSSRLEDKVFKGLPAQSAFAEAAGA